MSLPSWECGLKSQRPMWHRSALLSLPSWECGLKFSFRRYLQMRGRVAPFVGVWIEISNIKNIYSSRYVAPFVGVWIEIYTRPHIVPVCLRSLPSQECRFNYILLGVGYINIYKLSSIL